MGCSSISYNKMAAVSFYGDRYFSGDLYIPERKNNNPSVNGAYTLVKQYQKYCVYQTMFIWSLLIRTPFI